jgi:hypothetical protein
MEGPLIAISSSNQYFMEGPFLQTGAWFVSPTDIDVYVKDSFATSTPALLVNWWYIQSYNKDHLMSEEFVCYKLMTPNQQPIIVSQWPVRFNLDAAEWLFTGNMLQSFLQGMPLLAIIWLTLLTTILPAPISTVFRYISLIAMLVGLFYYAYKMIRYFIGVLFNKGVDYGWVKVIFDNPADNSVVSPAYVEILKELRKQFLIQNVVLYSWNLYFKQQLKKVSFWGAIKSAFYAPIDSEQEVQMLIQKTVNFLVATSFIPSANPQQ